MPRFYAYGTVVGNQFIGAFEADTVEEAEEMAWDQAGVSVCHQCSQQVEDAEISKIIMEKAE